jgi:hypothetical protein
MIITESKKMGIPIVGLIGSESLVSLDYPILGNTNSVYLVHFFCYFLSTLISKQLTNKQHILFKFLLRNSPNMFSKKEINTKCVSEKIRSFQTNALFTKTQSGVSASSFNSIKTTNFQPSKESKVNLTLRHIRKNNKYVSYKTRKRRVK